MPEVQRDPDSPNFHGDLSEGRVRGGLESAMITLFKQYYGKGPAAAKALVREEYVVVVMEDGLTRNEETLLADGQEEQIRQFRLAFQQSVRDRAMQMVSEVTGRAVLAYYSQIMFQPVRAFELFVLAERPIQ
jgi:uncharacterized protein YbcI